jgi:hypothetical protein
MKSGRHLVAITAVLFAGSVAVANVPGPQPTPSARLSMEMDVKPAVGQPGRFVVSSTITDLETNAVVGRPTLLVESEKIARVEAGADGKWMLQISVLAGNTSKQSTYEATFTREGKVISKQRFSVDLNG